MPHTFARAVLASAIALGTLVFSAGSAVPGDTNQYPAINPYAGPHNGGTVVVVREPQLLMPADLKFSIDKEGDVTVVRGPIAR